MSASPNWTKEEIEVLREAYPRLGRCKELQELFPTRPLQGITLKANRLGFKVLNNLRVGRTNEEYLSLVENTNFVPLQTYAGSTTPILHMCGICEYEWLARPQHILRVGARCPICDEKWRLDTAYTKVQETLKLANMEQLSPYLGALQKITLKHIDCGYTWDTVYSYVQQGSGCPICNIGFGYKYAGNNIPEKANIYLFKITTLEAEFYKIGVTVRPVHRRSIELKACVPNIQDISLIHEYSDTGTNILLKEKRILMCFKQYTHTSKFDGCTELLPIDTEVPLIKEIMNEKL